MADQKKRVEQGSEEWKRLRRRAQTDLFWLNWEVLGHREVVPMTYRAHYAMCRFAERKTAIPEVNAARIQLIHVPRGVGKSTLITKGRTIQRLLQDSEWAAGIANERQGNAAGFLAMIKQEFEHNDYLRWLFPELIPDFRSVKWRSDEIEINRKRPNPVNPSVYAVGTDTALASKHMNEWIVDDLLSRDAAENARSGLGTEIEKLNRWVTQLQPLLKSPKRDPITFIGTPWWPGDTYDHIRKVFGRGETPTEYLWNLQLPDGETQTITLAVAGELAEFRVKAIHEGRPLFPERYDLEELDAMREDDPVFFQAQYMLEPAEGGIVIFKPDWLRPFEWDSHHQIRYRDDDGRMRFERVRDMRVLISVDPAISKKATSARSAINVVASNGERLFLLESWAQRAGPSDVASQVISFYQRYPHTSRIIVEDVAYQTALADIMALLAKEASVGALPIYGFKTGTQERKDVRIAGLEPYFRKGFFYWHPQSQQEFFDEYMSFAPGVGLRKVDILDSLSMQKESWEALAFLGNTPGGERHRDAYADAQRRVVNKLRDRYARNRTREWEQPSAWPRD